METLCILPDEAFKSNVVNRAWKSFEINVHVLRSPLNKQKIAMLSSV